ncbi:MAG: hypothetical protein K6B46_05470 [Opitutales bacterium]|nr:hypothetical protein [Opitutales bacterium]
MSGERIARERVTGTPKKFLTFSTVAKKLRRIFLSFFQGGRRLGESCSRSFPPFPQIPFPFVSAVPATAAIFLIFG